MSMDITSNYNAYEGAYATQKKATKNTEGKESHIITSTVELKTSTPGKRDPCRAFRQRYRYQVHF